MHTLVCTFANTKQLFYFALNVQIFLADTIYYFAHDDEVEYLLMVRKLMSNPYIGVGVQQAYTGFISPTNTVEVRI